MSVTIDVTNVGNKQKRVEITIPENDVADLIAEMIHFCFTQTNIMTFEKITLINNGEKELILDRIYYDKLTK